MARLTNGGVIGKITTTPTISSAIGKWNISDHIIYKQQGLWTRNTPNVEYLVIAGGGGTSGGAGEPSGGGGAGGYLTGTQTLENDTSYTLTIGAGGAGASGITLGTSGVASTVFSITSTGGGRGGTGNAGAGATGGSGGGGSGWNLSLIHI